MFHSIIDALVGLAAVVAILNFFGIKPKQLPSWRIMPLSQKWKLAIMLALVAAALGMSGYNFYRALRPKTVERTVEKVIEKPVSIPCPEPPKANPTSPNAGQRQPKKDNVQVVQAPNATQQSSGDCSPNQIGINNTNNCVPPLRKLPADQQTRMIQYLSSTKHKLTIGSLVGDEEAGEFATALADTFERSGWKVERVIGRQMQTGISHESITVSLYAPPGSTTSDNETATIAVNALRNAGIRVAVNFDSTLDRDTVNLYVGARKPN
ncbi:MAG: hypothetical protein ACHQIK_00640 [Candidatus Acidiferrales bacterium]